MKQHELKDRRVVIMGLGRFGGGVGAARFCVHQGARVLVTDLLAEGELTASIAKLDGLPIDYRLGGHEVDDFAKADLVIVNPAVDLRNNRFLNAATQRKVPITTEIRLLVERLPNRAHTIGITGTAGKSTTTAMIAHILTAAFGRRNVHMGGNIGGSLLGELDQITPEHWVVLELSSFMLDMLEGWSPHIAVVTNIGDNHLDRHGNIDAYVKAKKTIFRQQNHEDRVVLGPSVADWRFDTAAVSIIEDEPIEEDLLVPGEHNQLNAALAITACESARVSRTDAIHALRSFPGLPHRLQLVATHKNVRYYNDSKSTTPEAGMLAIDSFDHDTVHLILGGYDKHADLSPLARYAASRCAAVYTIGHTGPAIGDAIERQSPHCPVRRCGLLEVAVKEAAAAARAGQSVVLSPACASYDQFTNYEARGQAFADAVMKFVK
ncbi:MAG: hypothetical protein GC162_13270 [Planctomycetes bacterium]|nr:hypothetical protein [Planctomycetota bacterium]